MSDAAVTRDARVAHMLALTPLEQQMCLSMLGLHVWRLHREQGLQTSLLLALHAPVEEFDTFTWGIHQVLAALPRTARFRTLDALATVIARGTDNLAQHEFTIANTYHCGVDIRTLAEQYGVDQVDNLEVQWAGELATFILDCYFEKSAKVQGFEPWVAVWFELCDAAAGVTA